MGEGGQVKFYAYKSRGGGGGGADKVLGEMSKFFCCIW